MTESDALVDKIAEALAGEMPDLHPSRIDQAARVAARVTRENQRLRGAHGEWPTHLLQQQRPDLTVVRDAD